MKKVRILRQSVKNQLDRISNDPKGPPYRIINLPDGTDAVIDVTSPKATYDSIMNLPDCCFGARFSRQEVYNAIDKERDYQDLKYGSDKQQSIPGFLVILRKELEEAEDGWMKDTAGRDSVLSEIVQIAATAVACLEKYGVEGWATATDDIPHDS